MNTVTKPRTPSLAIQAKALLASLRERGFEVRPAADNPDRLLVGPGAKLTTRDKTLIPILKPYLLLLLAPERLTDRVLADVAALYHLRPAMAAALEATIIEVAGDVDALLTLHSTALAALVEARAGGAGEEETVRGVLAEIAGHGEMVRAA
jgi:hypothetical protein